MANVPLYRKSTIKSIKHSSADFQRNITEKQLQATMGDRKQILLDEWSKHRDTNGDERGNDIILIFKQYIAEISHERSQTHTRICIIFVAIKDLENAFASYNKWSQTAFCNIHCESKKQGTTIMSITSPNVGRFSNFFSLTNSLVNMQQNGH